ncbi:MAG: GNAT family N-acetyltransferase [Spirochaetia bacterium]|nr:GNAT family N-acetyltransferase [Spirochaetia bacterium]
MELVLARDLSELREKYIEIIEKTPDISRHARWEYGKHPGDPLLQAYMDNDEMYLLMDGPEIAGVMAVTMYQGEDYHDIDWSRELEDDQVASVHILGVCPGHTGKHLGRRLVQEAIALAREKGKKALRLDTLDSNKPAQHMYESLGFCLRGKANRYAENTGWTGFLYYEYALED